MGALQGDSAIAAPLKFSGMLHIKAAGVRCSCRFGNTGRHQSLYLLACAGADADAGVPKANMADHQLQYGCKEMLLPSARPHSDAFRAERTALKAAVCG